MFNPIGVDLLFGLGADSITATADQAMGASKEFDIVRMAAVGALRARLMFQNNIVRGSLALGPSISERIGIVSKQTADYLSFGGTVDAQFALRMNQGTAFAIGCMFWAESGPTASVALPSDSKSPFLIATGAQYFIQPHIGLEWGP
jgi:hypothetical protein